MTSSDPAPRAATGSRGAVSRWRLVVPLALMVAITVASSRPGDTLPMPGFQFSDKLIHAAAFATLAFAWAWALAGLRAALVVAFSIGAVFGIADELHQSTVPGRFPDVFDWLADTVGSFLGVASFRAWRSRQENHGDHSQLSRQDPKAQ